MWELLQLYAGLLMARLGTDRGSHRPMDGGRPQRIGHVEGKRGVYCAGDGRAPSKEAIMDRVETL
jgi:hypothetical protein